MPVGFESFCHSIVPFALENVPIIGRILRLVCNFLRSSPWSKATPNMAAKCVLHICQYLFKASVHPSHVYQTRTEDVKRLLVTAVARSPRPLTHCAIAQCDFSISLSSHFATSTNFHVYSIWNFWLLQTWTSPKIWQPNVFINVRPLPFTSPSVYHIHQICLPLSLGLDWRAARTGHGSFGLCHTQTCCLCMQNMILGFWHVRTVDPLTSFYWAQILCTSWSVARCPKTGLPENWVNSIEYNYSINSGN